MQGLVSTATVSWAGTWHVFQFARISHWNLNRPYSQAMLKKYQKNNQNCTTTKTINLLHDVMKRLQFQFKYPAQRGVIIAGISVFPDVNQSSWKCKITTEKKDHKIQLTTTVCLEIVAAIAEPQARVIAVARLIVQILDNRVQWRFLHHAGRIAPVAAQGRLPAGPTEGTGHTPGHDHKRQRNGWPPRGTHSGSSIGTHIFNKQKYIFFLRRKREKNAHTLNENQPSLGTFIPVDHFRRYLRRWANWHVQKSN